jgi:DNA-binding transcriptional ArsR family regulator
MHSGLAITANLLAEPARAAILLNLLDGRSVPAGELALAANVSPQTASGHLSKLMEGKLVDVERQGRHRYYRLFGTEVADAIEALLVLTKGTRQTQARSTSEPLAGTIKHARICYAHMAGWLGVQITDALQREGLLLPASGKAFAVSDRGCCWFEGLEISIPACYDRPSAKVAKQCLDWTERRPHLAGVLGVAMYKRFLALRWIACLPNSRVLRVTVEGRQQLWKQLRISIR